MLLLVIAWTTLSTSSCDPLILHFADLYRQSLATNPWPAVGNLTVMIHINDQNDAPEVVNPTDGMTQSSSPKPFYL